MAKKERENRDMTKYKYYEVVATIDGQDEVMFGSYVRSECEYEKRAESPSLREEGYRNVRISHRLVEEAPDPEIYNL